MSKKHVTVIRGGISFERDVSLASGSNVIDALKEAGYQVSDLVANDDLGQIVQFLKEHRPDVVFNALHGRFGEDGAIQGVLEWMNIPYTHGGICSSAIAMNKQMTRILLADAGLPVATGKVIPFQELAFQDPLPPPYVVKPIEEGSSFGVYIVTEADAKLRQEKREKIVKEWHFGVNMLVEEFIPGKELTICVMQDKALTITDISSGAHSFYDYTSKYTAGESKHVLPAQIHPKAFQDAMRYAEQAHKILGCYPTSRTDFRYDNTHETQENPGRLCVLEVNTQPGMTKTSLLPEQASYCGISYADLCSWLVEHARCRL